MGKLTLHSVYDQFRSDMFLSSLAESSMYIVHTNLMNSTFVYSDCTTNGHDK